MGDRDQEVDPNAEGPQIQVGSDVRGGRKRETKYDTKLRAKEIYIESMADCMTNLSKEAVEDGLGEFYDDAVDDFLTNIPSKDLSEIGPCDAFLKLLEVYWKRIKALIPEDKQDGIEPPLGDHPEDKSFLSVLIFLEGLVPEDYGFERGSKEHKQIRRIITVLKKRIAIDVIDESELLRGKERIYQQSDDLFDIEVE